MDIKVLDINGKNLRFKVPKLHCKIKAKDSYITIKSN